MIERDKLIDELELSYINRPLGYAASMLLPIEFVAEWIIEDRKRICEPLINYKKSVSNNKLWVWGKCPEDKIIDETLKLAGLDKEGS